MHVWNLWDSTPLPGLRTAAISPYAAPVAISIKQTLDLVYSSNSVVQYLPHLLKTVLLI